MAHEEGIEKSSEATFHGCDRIKSGADPEPTLCHLAELLVRHSLSKLQLKIPVVLQPRPFLAAFHV